MKINRQSTLVEPKLEHVIDEDFQFIPKWSIPITSLYAPGCHALVIINVTIYAALALQMSVERFGSEVVVYVASNGGSPDAAMHMARVLSAHQTRVVVYFAHSSAALLCLLDRANLSAATSVLLHGAGDEGLPAHVAKELTIGVAKAAESRSELFDRPRLDVFVDNMLDLAAENTIHPTCNYREVLGLLKQTIN